jgi:3-phosphoshikimate 1-carboxyvinyltransferase
MVGGLRRAGARIEEDHRGVRVEGLGGPPRQLRGEVDAGDAGTVLRFLLPFLAAGEGSARVTGSARLAQRPIGPLLDVLEKLGARCRERSLPIVLEARGLHGGKVWLDASESSQFASGLLLAAPAMGEGIDLVLEPPVRSRSYLDLTCRVMGDFGIEVERPGPERFLVAPGSYRAASATIDGDGGAASFLLAAAAVAGGRVRVAPLAPNTGEPDARILALLSDAGCIVRHETDAVVLEGPAMRSFDVDLADTPDLLPPLAAVAAVVPGRSTLRGVPHARWKESDRIAALAQGLRRCGVEVEELEDGLRIDGGGAGLRGADIDPRHDHRIAMAFAVLGLRAGGMGIRDPECVSKSFPSFFETLASLASPASPRRPSPE